MRHLHAAMAAAISMALVPTTPPGGLAGQSNGVGSASSAEDPGLEVRFHPADSLLLYEVDPDQGRWNAVVQNVAVVNRGAEAVTVESIVLRLEGPGTIRSVEIGPAALSAGAAQFSAMQSAGVLDLYDFHFQTSRLIPDGATLASTPTLAPGEGLIITGTALSADAPTGTLRVTAAGTTAAGRSEFGEATLSVGVATPEIVVESPVKGVWYVAAAPTFHSHHRWGVPSEFALDLVVLDEDGEMSTGDGTRSEHYHSYSLPVHAVADGVVIDAEADAIEDETRYRQPGESAESWQSRTVAAQNRLLAESPRAVSGNFVVIRHDGGYYSNYLHLQEGSVRVSVGDMVRAGQVIGAVGQTGNSDAPHLHFQVVNGEDALYSRGLPVRFSDTEVVGFGWTDRYLQTGWFFKTR